MTRRSTTDRIRPAQITMSILPYWHTERAHMINIEAQTDLESSTVSPFLADCRSELQV